MVSAISSPSSTGSGPKKLWRRPSLAVGWMGLTSLLGAALLGLIVSGTLRTVVENKERELLSSRHLTLSVVYRASGLPGVEKILRHSEFRDYYLQLTAPDGRVVLEQNLAQAHFHRVFLPMPALNGRDAVPDWLETHSDDGLDYDFLTRRLHDGGTLRMGFSESAEEAYFQRLEKLMGQIAGGFLILGLLGAAFLLYQSKTGEKS